MNNKLKPIIIVVIVILASFSFWLFKNNGGNPASPTPTATDIVQPKQLDFLNLPAGFIISRFAEGLTDPRVIAFDGKGRMLISETENGRVTMLIDVDKDGKAETKKTILKDLNLPHGLAFYSDAKSGKYYLYVAQNTKVNRYLYDLNKGIVIDEKNSEDIVNLPADGRHFTRTIAFGPNYQTNPIVQGGSVETMSPIKLYVSVGSSCDTCIEDSWKRATILESDPDGNYAAELAGGLRNSVFFDFQPQTKEMWATEMGRDGLGDNLPPDEINIIKPGKKYGWPFCYGNQIKDTTFKYGKITRTDLTDDCSKTEKPVIEILAHSAPMGLAFISSTKWPKDWQNDLLVAYHGSSQSSKLTGYKVVRFQVDKSGKEISRQDFISGWLSGDKVLGRPTDLKFGPDGALYVSDDSTGVIYKIEHKG